METNKILDVIFHSKHTVSNRCDIKPTLVVRWSDGEKQQISEKLDGNALTSYLQLRHFSNHSVF